MIPRNRVVALVLALLLALTAVVSVSSAPTVYAAPQTCEGVWVVVQDSSGNSAQCAAEYSDGVEALQSAGYVAAGSASSYGYFVDQIGGAPSDTNFATNGGLWWAFCTAQVDAGTGAISAWTASAVGAFAVNRTFSPSQPLARNARVGFPTRSSSAMLSPPSAS